MQMLNNLPLYKVVLDDTTKGLFCISLVEEPAIERGFVKCAKKEKIDFKTTEDKYIFGCAIRANYPIYRGDKYLVFDKEIIQTMAEQYAQGEKIVSFNHDGNEVKGVYLEQIFIKDKEKGINPKGFEDCEDGSLFAKFRIENKEVFEKFDKGEITGFSVEVEVKFEPKLEKMGLIKKTALAFREWSVEKEKFKSYTSETGDSLYTDEDELEVGIVIYKVEDEYPELAPAGQYKLPEEGVEIDVNESGEIVEIRELEEEEKEEEEKEEEKLGVTEDTKKALLDALKNSLSDIHGDLYLYFEKLIDSKLEKRITAELNKQSKELEKTKKELEKTKEELKETQENFAKLEKDFVSFKKTPQDKKSRDEQLEESLNYLRNRR